MYLSECEFFAPLIADNLTFGNIQGLSEIMSNDKKYQCQEWFPPLLPESWSEWSAWSECSAKCSAPVQDEYCPKRHRMRYSGQSNLTGGLRGQEEKQSCNCSPCTYRYSDWVKDKCEGTSNCHKVSYRYCQYVAADGSIISDSKVDRRDLSIYKCSDGWRDYKKETWHYDCGRNCPTTCKWLGKIGGSILGVCPD